MENSGKVIDSDDDNGRESVTLALGPSFFLYLHSLWLHVVRWRRWSQFRCPPAAQSIQSANLSVQLSKLGPLTPIPNECCSPPFGSRWGDTLREGGGGGPIPTMGQTLLYSMYAIITLRCPAMIHHLMPIYSLHFPIFLSKINFFRTWSARGYIWHFAIKEREQIAKYQLLEIHETQDILPNYIFLKSYCKKGLFVF